MKYCEKCGNQMHDEAVLCVRCGCLTESAKRKFDKLEGYVPASLSGVSYSTSSVMPGRGLTTPYHIKDIINQISERIKINGIIWVCIGLIQVLLGVYVVIENMGFEYVPVMIIGVVNVVIGCKDIGYSSEITICPLGIVKKYEPIGNAVFTLVYNLLLGGVIGVIGSIYYFVGVRSLVMNNAIGLEKEEKAYLESRRKW